VTSSTTAQANATVGTQCIASCQNRKKATSTSCLTNNIFVYAPATQSYKTPWQLHEECGTKNSRRKHTSEIQNYSEKKKLYTTVQS